MKVIDFIGAIVTYDREAQMIFGNKGSEDGQQLIGNIIDVRGWGSIQNMFKDDKGKIDVEKAMKFQDEMGQFMADAINEKLQRERQSSSQKQN